MRESVRFLIGQPVLYLLVSVAAFWAWTFYEPLAGIESVLGAVHPAAAVGALGLTATNLLLRFMRWHFLLRRCGLYLPTRQSAALFTAALPMALTPLYLGELIKPYVLKQQYRFPMPVSLTVVVMERLLDLLVLSGLGALGERSGAARWVALGAFLVLACIVMCRPLVFRFVHLVARVRFLPVVSGVLRPSMLACHTLSESPVLTQALALTVIAWVVACGSLPLLSMGSPGSPGLLEGLSLYAAATTAGALTGLPGGIGATEITLRTGLLRGGLSPSQAMAIVLMIRLLTLWVAFLLGAIVLLTRYRRYLSLRPEPEPAHFEDLSSVYDAQIPSHVRERLLHRKVSLMETALRNAGLGGSRGLDVGCGTGWYSVELERRGFRVTSLDRSRQQAGHARDLRDAASQVVVGDAIQLPFRDATFDFAFAINVVHHLPDRAAQAESIREIRRVLQPHGLFLLHEINVSNPLFRLYMVYLFPVIRDIDQGTEHWILPAEQTLFRGFEREGVHYFTFLPDFAPPRVVHVFEPLERFLERSPARSWSAHYMMILRADGAL